MEDFYKKGCTLEAWQRVWREGVAPLLSDNALTALANALRIDDPRLVQGATTVPPPLECVKEWTCEGACLIGFAGWQGDGLETVAEVEEFFSRMCFEIDQRTGEPAGVRRILNYFDETPRDDMRKSLLPEVEAAIAKRQES